MMHRVRSLVTVLALGAPTLAMADRLPPAPPPPPMKPVKPAAPAPVPPPKKPMATPLQTFLMQDKYTYCDVKILSALWKSSIGDSKSRVGMKLQANDTRTIETELVAARTNARKNPSARCSFHDAGFTYDDAKLLAKRWNKNIAGAKAMAEDKILGGGEKFVRDIVRQNGGNGGAGTTDPVSAFLAQDKYTYCDVKLLGALWKSSMGDSKARVGMKLQAGSTVYLDNELRMARANAVKLKLRCSYAEAGFSYTDVEQLAKLWKVNVAAAKVRIEKKAISAGVQMYRDQLAAAGGGAANDPDIRTFLSQDRYTYCDAKMLAGAWKQSVEETKSLIGSKIKDKSFAALDASLKDSREFAKKNPPARCSFHDAGFTYDDATKLAKLWKTTEGDAKTRVEKKILDGNERLVRADLKVAIGVKQPVKPLPPPPGIKAPPTKAPPPMPKPPTATKQ